MVPADFGTSTGPEAERFTVGTGWCAVGNIVDLDPIKKTFLFVIYGFS